MLGQLFLGAGMICLTVVVQANAFEYLTRLILQLTPLWLQQGKRRTPTPLIVLTVLAIFAVHTVQVWIWSACYLIIGETDGLAQSLYFSTVTFTTLGYGDVTLTARWQLLSSLEAVNGILMFGWSTAFIFRIMTYLWERNRERQQPQADQATGNGEEEHARG